ncbi:histidine triad nucleotide-binding protein [Lentzea guizhouensis]|uniref:histidine triad nucleotide-binding protein n=1 Tax=Lentzea guizhouensis TaxID=1586287 RepID=UPI001F1EFCAF|nr:histidine triad nucleotide-binding protein [Lentzea guizhouensis]
MTDSVNDCLFCRIVAGEIPATVVAETDTTLAFRDIDPKAPTHVLVIPKEHHRAVGDLDPVLAGQVLATAHQVAKSEGVDETGYRLVFNTGRDGGQTVFHVHCHVLGGRGLSWPPG